MKAIPIDVPSAAILDSFQDEIKKQIESTVLPDKSTMKVEKIEWTKEGLRVWILKK